MRLSVNRKLLFVAISSAMCLSSCTVGPDYQRPASPSGESWIATISSEDVDADWWTRFNDPLLTELVDAAIIGNKDLAEANARLREARANRDAVYGRALPQAGISAKGTQNRLSENGQLPVGKVPGLGRNLSIFDVGFDASWEIDLWGGTTRAIESAEARAQAAKESQRGVIIQIIAEVVRAYIDLRAAQCLEKNAIANAEAHQNITRLITDRLRVGSASRSDLVRSETQARNVAAVIPAYSADAAAAAFRLALLLGKPPEGIYGRLRKSGPLPSANMTVHAGLRSDILRRRPDIRKAERELAAFTAEIGVATAELFPKISLLGGIGLQARNTGDLFSSDSLRLQIGPSFHWPIFSGGRIKAQIRAADARADGALSRYEKAVIGALADSETAINRYDSAGLVRVERDAARASAAEALSLARQRYHIGEDDLTTLLQVQIAYNAADRAAIQAHASQLQQLSALYKALGGGWEAVERRESP